MSEKNIAGFIQSILEQHKGFMKVKDIPASLSLDMRRELQLKRKEPVKTIMNAVEPVLRDRFVFVSKGAEQFILLPEEPSEFVISFLASLNKPTGPKTIRKSLPFMKTEDLIRILSELAEKGRIKIVLNDKFEPRVVLCDTQKSESSIASGEYTREKFREAFEACDNGRTFVHIPDMRKVLGWPREVFDEMLRKLRDEEVLQIYRADESTMTADEVKDCFVDENGFRMGTVTWDAR